MHQLIRQLSATCRHCQKGMVFAINPTAEKSFDAYKAKALASTAPAAGAPAAGGSAPGSAPPAAGGAPGSAPPAASGATGTSAADGAPAAGNGAGSFKVGGATAITMVGLVLGMLL